MTPKKRGLGRGLNALIGGDASVEEKETQRASAEKRAVDKDAVKEDSNGFGAAAKEKDRVLMLKLDEIEPDKQQPRQVFDDDRLQELTESVKVHGVLQPLIVQKTDEKYRIIAGERRYRAAVKAGLSEVPVLVRAFDKQQTLEVALIENIQREDLNPIEEAQGFRRLMKEYQLKQDDIAKRVGKSRSAIANALRLLNLDDEVQWMVSFGTLSTGHAKVLMALSDKEQQRRVAKLCEKNAWSVRVLEEQIKKILAPKPSEKKREKTAEELAFERAGAEMQEILGTKVSIVQGKNKGKIEIEYYSEDELERLMSLMRRLG